MDGNFIFNNVGNIILPLGNGLIFHPLTNCKILMQLGYEPNPPFMGHTLLSLLGLGPKVKKYPSIVAYSSKVVERVGWKGLFLIGLPAKLCYTTVFSIVTEKVYDQIIKDDGENKKKLLDTSNPFKEYLGEMAIVAAARVSGVIISYPFEVIMIRQVAQILEENGAGSSSMLTWFMKILKEEGLVGFYGGVSSKIFGELLSLSVAATFVYGINNYVLSKSSNDDMREYTPVIANIMTSSLVYKYSIISTLLAISGSGLVYAIPFTGFSEAYDYLRIKKGFTRGSSLFLRYAS